MESSLRWNEQEEPYWMLANHLDGKDVAHGSFHHFTIEKLYSLQPSTATYSSLFAGVPPGFRKTAPQDGPQSVHL